MKFTTIASSFAAIAFLAASSVSAAASPFVALESFNLKLDSFASTPNVSAECTADANAFAYDANSCAPGVVQKGDHPKVQLTQSQYTCICASNALVDITNAAKDCPASQTSDIEDLISQWRQFCPGAKSVGTSTVVPAGVDPFNPQGSQKSGAASVGISLMGSVGVAVAALVALTF
ncbi:hypothetical protein HDU76_005555 [Blyttiomyces sp. JEL0837]|nr:hypothetical protein HDU76_005555 [Blyttiomyces sp. JEL0837]